MHVLSWLAFVAVTLSAAPALAYVGPGAGLSFVGAFWGLLVAIFAALAFVIVWPIRRLLKRKAGPADAAQGAPSDGSLSPSAQRRA